MLGHSAKMIPSRGTRWSCGCPTPQLNSPRPQPQYIFNDMRQNRFGVLMSPDSFRTLVHTHDGVWLCQTAVSPLNVLLNIGTGIRNSCVTNFDNHSTLLAIAPVTLLVL